MCLNFLSSFLLYSLHTQKGEMQIKRTNTMNTGSPHLVTAIELATQSSDEAVAK